MKFLGKLVLNAVVVGMMLPMPGLFGMQKRIPQNDKALRSLLIEFDEEFQKARREKDFKQMTQHRKNLEGYAKFDNPKLQCNKISLREFMDKEIEHFGKPGAPMDAEREMLKAALLRPLDDEGQQQESKERESKRKCDSDAELKKLREDRDSSRLVPISSKDNPLLPQGKSVLDVYQDGLMAYSKVSAWGFGSRMGALAKRNRLQEISGELLPHKNDSDIAELLTMLDKDIKKIDKILQDMEREEKEKEDRLTEAQQIVAQYGQVESKCSAAAAQPKADKEIKSEKSGLLAAPEISISRPHSWRRNIVFASIFAVAAAIGAWFWFSRSKVS